MGRWARRGGLAAAVLGLAAVLTAAATAGSSGTTVPSGTAQQPATPRTALAQSVASLQDTLRRRPTDDRSWAALGQAYLQQARLTADPSYFGKAAAALTTSLRLRPKDNSDALVGQATLASGQHEFGRALALADQALAVNPYSASAYAVRTDALTELGRYDEARKTAQQLLNLRPGVDSFARASYQFELRGQVDQARAAMQRAADTAAGAADKAFALHYLGELAFNNADRATALRQYAAALAADPSYVPSIAGRARALAAGGDVAGALVGYREAVQRQPQPAFLVELGELLQANGQQAAANEQYDVVRATARLFEAQGANVDLELALFEADHGTAAEALRYASAAYRARPAAVLVQDAYAWALHRAGRTAEALPIARQAAAQGLRPALVSYHLGVIEAALGDRVGARRDLTAALAKSPGFNPLQAPAARRLLDSLA